MNEAVKEHTEIATREDAVPATEAGELMQVIANAARDSNVDVEKMRALLEMKKEVMRDDAERQFNDAMNAVQEKVRPISADASNPQTKSKYASYTALDKSLRPIYTANGFSLSFDTGDSPPEGHVRVVCYVSHRAGYTRTYHADMPADGKGAKGGDVMTKTHATGSAMSYGMRYLLKMIFNVAVGEDDDDGNKAGSGEKISVKQRDELLSLADDVGADKVAFCRYFEIDGFGDIPAKAYGRAKAALEKKREKADA